LIEELEFCKKMEDDIGVRLKDNRTTAAKLNETAEKYRTVARRGAVLFFVMDSLKKICFENNAIKDRGVIALAKALEENDTLLSLYLENN
jgi:hypothetical protein